jgi:hypothetical protein
LKAEPNLLMEKNEQNDCFRTCSIQAFGAQPRDK